jgi:hypothetical protein
VARDAAGGVGSAQEGYDLMRLPLQKREKQAEAHLRGELHDHLSLAREMYNVGTDAIDLVRGNLHPYRPSAGARLALLAKLLSDLRAATVVALNGYAPQAAVIGSSLYETAMTATYIGTDDTLAQAWSKHGKTKPTEPFKTIWTLTEGVVRRFVIDNIEAITAARYRVYSEMCLAKHNNALFLAQHVFLKVGDDIAFVSGPDASEQAVRTASFVFAHGIALTHLAVGSLVKDFIEVPADLGTRLTAVMDKWTVIDTRSKTRWPTGDPFSGKWRTARRVPRVK